MSDDITWHGRSADGLLGTLTELWALWRQHGQKIDPQVWDGPSRIGEWTVKELYGHVARGVGVLESMLGRAEPGDPASTTFPRPEDYFANFRSWIDEAAAYSARVAVSYAAEHTPEEMVEAFTRSGPVLAALAEKIDLVLPTPFGTSTTTARAYLVTRVVEATVHLADLQRALDLELDVPDEATEVTALVLLDLSPRQEFIDAATGRAAPTFFPVLT